MPLPAEPPPSDEEMAGYLLWYCGGRGCAMTYAMAVKMPAVRDILVRRTEKHYTPPSKETIS